MEILIKGFIASKKAELFSDCEDRYAINLNTHKFAISDGVSKSFFPKFWAKILVDKYVNTETEETTEKHIEICQQAWKDKVTKTVTNPNVKWFTLNAYNRNAPALATFVGLQFFEKEKKWKASALGDSFLFFVPSKMKNFDIECIKLPSKQDYIFDNFPDCLSSVGDSHKGEEQIVEGELNEGTFYLMTDALSEWFINEKENAIGKICVWANQKDFEHFIDEERISERLGNDDSAILIIEIKKDKTNKFSYLKGNISDIDLLISEQEEIIKIRESEEAEKLKERDEEELDCQKINNEKALEPEEKIEIDKKQKESFSADNQHEPKVEEPEKGFICKTIENVKEKAVTIIGKKEKQPISNSEQINISENQTTEESNTDCGAKKNTEVAESSPKSNSSENSTEKKAIEEERPIAKNIKKVNIPSKSNIIDKF